MSHSSSADLQFNENLSDYAVIGPIGAGSFGTCYKVKEKRSKKYYVWKAVDYSSMSLNEKKLLVTEVNLLGTLKHQHIVQYYGRIVHHSSGTLYIIMEWCEGGDLGALIKECKSRRRNLSEKFVWKVLYQTARALEACHSLLKQVTVLHRDIKPANVFLDKDYNVKLGDFGLAKVLQHHNFSSTMVGTPYYMSPEQIHGSKYNKKSDVWSMGCLIYELCCLRQPFNGKDLMALRYNIVKNRLSRIPQMYSDHLDQMARLLLCTNYESRPPVEVIAYHPTVIGNYDANAKPFDSMLHTGNGDTVHRPGNLPVPIHPEVKELESRKDSAYELVLEDRFKLLRRREFILKAKENELNTRELQLKTKETTLECRQIQIERRERELATLQRSAEEQKSIFTNREVLTDVNLDSTNCSADTIVVPTAAKLDPGKVLRPIYFRKEHPKMVALRKAKRREDGIPRLPFFAAENDDAVQAKSKLHHNSVCRR